MVLVPEMTGNDARAYVEQSLWSLSYFKQQDNRPILGDATPVYEFLLEHGKEYSGVDWTEFRGSGWRRMTRQRCFENAFKAADRYGLTYCEGFASTGIFPLHHAWCVDGENRVVDFTWRADELRADPTEWQYFGISFDLTALAFHMRGKATWSCLFDLPYGEDFNAEHFLV